MKSRCVLVSGSYTSRIVAVWRDLAWGEKALRGLGVAPRGREFHQQVPSSWGAVFRGSGGFAKSKAAGSQETRYIERRSPALTRQKEVGVRAVVTARENFWTK